MRATPDVLSPIPPGAAPDTASLEEFRARWTKTGVDNFISERNGVITLSRVIVPKQHRGQGMGSRFMAELTAYADRTNQLVALSPGDDFGASSVARLERFYRRFGFVSNKGRRKDFRFSETMLRQPTPPPTPRQDLPLP